MPALLLLASSAIVPTADGGPGQSSVDVSAFPAGSPIRLDRRDDRLTLAWPISGAEEGRLSIDLRRDHPLIAEVGTASSARSPSRPILTGVDPLLTMTVGTPPSPRPAARRG